jgi:beta-galactosidase
MLLLVDFGRAGMNVVRVSESSWGNLETAPGVHNFGWLHDFLDDVVRHHMKAILGTSTYIAPQWLAAKNPDMHVQLQPGVSVQPRLRIEAIWR